jgi:hypothetical protein
MTHPNFSHLSPGAALLNTGFVPNTPTSTTYSSCKAGGSKYGISYTAEMQQIWQHTECKTAEGCQRTARVLICSAL